MSDEIKDIIAQLQNLQLQQVALVAQLQRINDDKRGATANERSTVAEPPEEDDIRRFAIGDRR
jgi:hypothetical protein